MTARHRLTPIVLAFALLPAPAAQAKGIARASICGADGCATVTQLAQGSGRCSGCSAEELMTVAPGTARPTRRAPFVRIMLVFGPPRGHVEERDRVLFAPSLRLAARSDGDGGWAWFRPSPMALELATRMARDVRPYPAARMPVRLAPAATSATARNPATRPRTATSDGSLIVPGTAVFGTVLVLGVAARRRRRRGR